MSLDAYRTIIFGDGKVTITKDGIAVEGFESVNASCRDVAVLACAWAIGELQREMTKAIQEPGNNSIVVG